MPPSSSPETLRETLDAFLDDDAGIPFEQLAAFAEPLFDLYQVDLRAGLQSAQGDGRVDEMASLVAVLETARLLWVYLGMHAVDRRERASSLHRILLGPNTGEAEKQDFKQLLANLKARRNQLVTSDDEVNPADFEKLLKRFADRRADSTSTPDETYGPDALPQEEARALFAQPLLETEEVLQNPSQMQEALARAETYWDLAHAAPDERQQRLRSLKNRFADSEQEKKEVEREARQMLDRFDQLFPDR